MDTPLYDLMDLSPAERRAVERGPIAWPDGQDLPSGWRYGAHVSGSVWWASHHGGAVVHLECRPDLDSDDVPEMTETLAEIAGPLNPQLPVRGAA